MIYILCSIFGIVCGILITWYLVKPKLNERIEINKQNQELNKRLELENNGLNKQNEMLNENLTSLSKHYEEQKSTTEKQLKDYAQLRENELNRQYKDLNESYKNEYLDLLNDYGKEFSLIVEEKKETLESLNLELNRMKSIVSAAVADNQRAKEERDKKDFYRIQISELDVQEIKKIREIEPYLRDTTPLNKVIWKSYYETPFTSLIGRVIGNEEKTGIYKITNLLDGDVYIGQSTKISTRWREHVKRGIGADAPTRNKLYTAMLKDGVENFTFEIIEECDADSLDDREKFWIDYFSSKTCGYNMTQGNNSKESI